MVHTGPLNVTDVILLASLTTGHTVTYTFISKLSIIGAELCQKGKVETVLH